MAHIKEFIAGRCKIMAKIENPTSVIDIEAIAKIVDVVMVARGDLAVEARLCRVSLLQ